MCSYLCWSLSTEKWSFLALVLNSSVLKDLIAKQCHNFFFCCSQAYTSTDLNFLGMTRHKIVLQKIQINARKWNRNDETENKSKHYTFLTSQIIETVQEKCYFKMSGYYAPKPIPLWCYTLTKLHTVSQCERLLIDSGFSRISIGCTAEMIKPIFERSILKLYSTIFISITICSGIW